MKIFCDNHHGDLYYAIHSLFETRLGFELYRPIGMDWFYEGFWKIAEPYGNALETVGQYLDPSPTKWHTQPTLNNSHYVLDDVYYVYEHMHNYYHRAITLEKFKTMEFDIILSTIQPHDIPYMNLQKLYQPKAKVMAHLGNTGQITCIPNVIHSVPYRPLSKQNSVYWHQELDLNFYKYVPINYKTKNLFAITHLYPYSEIWNQYKISLFEFDMKFYGAGCPDGILMKMETITGKMQEANIGWHLKPQGGLGHTAMGWAISGRPLIVNMSQHKSWGGDAIRLFEPGVTCVDIEANSFEDNCKIIRNLLEPDVANYYSENIRKRFWEIINYDKEEQDVRIFLENLL